MDSIERIYTTVKEHKKADRIPWSMNFGAYQCTTRKYLREYKESRGIDRYFFDYLDYDILNVNPPEITDAFGEGGGIGYLSNGIDPSEYYTKEELGAPGAFTDAFGMLFTPWRSEPEYCQVISPLRHIETAAEAAAYPFPEIDRKSAEDVARQAEQIHRRKKLVSADCGGLFGASWYLRGMENYMMDMYEDPDIAELIAERMTQSLIERAEASADAGVDLFCYADDLGMEKSPQLDPAMWRKIFKPRWARVFEAIRRKKPDALIFMHSCGYIIDFIDDFIEIGLDILHPIQPESMNVYEIYEKYHERLAIWGTISMQRTMPFGTPEEVKREVRERTERMNRGSFILSPSNVLSKDVPFENLDALIEACREYC